MIVIFTGWRIAQEIYNNPLYKIQNVTLATQVSRDLQTRLIYFYYFQWYLKPLYLDIMENNLFFYEPVCKCYPGVILGNRYLFDVYTFWKYL